MTNREKLLHTNLYDLLCRMEENAENHPECDACVIELLGVDRESYCKMYVNCNNCIAEWLNERSE